MERRSCLAEMHMQKYMPLMLAACFFVFSAALYLFWAVSPQKQAEELLRDMYSYSIYSYERKLPSGAESLDMPDSVTQLDYGYPMPVERVSVGDVRMVPEEGADVSGNTFRYELEYYVVLFKGDEAVTPVIPGSTEGVVSVEMKGAFAWDITDIRRVR